MGWLLSVSMSMQHDEVVEEKEALAVVGRKKVSERSSARSARRWSMRRWLSREHSRPADIEGTGRSQRGGGCPSCRGGSCWCALNGGEPADDDGKRTRTLMRFLVVLVVVLVVSPVVLVLMGFSELLDDPPVVAEENRRCWALNLWRSGGVVVLEVIACDVSCDEGICRVCVRGGVRGVCAVRERCVCGLGGELSGGGWGLCGGGGESCVEVGGSCVEVAGKLVWR